MFKAYLWNVLELFVGHIQSFRLRCKLQLCGFADKKEIGGFIVGRKTKIHPCKLTERKDKLVGSFSHVFFKVAIVFY